MPEDFLIGKKSLLKVDSNRNYVKENKTQLSVDVNLLANKKYNRFDVSKDPTSVFLNNPPVSTLDFPIDYVYIGGQFWMQKNLNVSVYANGDPIPEVQDTTQWANLTTGAWCYYNNDPANGEIYGKLYNGYAMRDPRGLAPSGWRIPTPTDFTSLATYLGGVLVAGGEMKQTGTTYWQSPNYGATNSSRFTALPGGVRTFSGTFSLINEYAYFWEDDPFTPTSFSWRRLFNGNIPIYRTTSINLTSLKGGLSVRCLKN